MAIRSNSPCPASPSTTEVETPAARASPERVHAMPSPASSSTRRRASVMRSGAPPQKRRPSSIGSGSKAAGARRNMRATMPGAVSVQFATHSAKRRASASSGGQSKTSAIGLSFFASTVSAGPCQTMPATWRGPSGTRTIEPACTSMPAGTA
jgi:hypothetical protein